jgi:protein-tyrosine phosphatase
MTLGRSRFVLIEAPSTELPWFFEKLLFDLMIAGFRPVLAHPERNPTLRNDFKRMAAISRTGVVLQVNTRSLSGVYGLRVQSCAERLARERHVGLTGSDAHRPDDYIGLARARVRIRELGGDGALAAIKANEDALLKAVTGTG